MEVKAVASKRRARRRTLFIHISGYGSASQFNFGEMIRQPGCNPGVIKSVGSEDCRAEAQRRRATPNCADSFSANHFGSVAQSEEQPVVCGKAEGASPFGSANFKAYREADSQ